jgi:hypothetical protein
MRPGQLSSSALARADSALQLVSGSWRPTPILVAGLVVALLVVFFLVSSGIFSMTSVGQCDGSVPRWMIQPGDAGCVVIRPAWEAWLPWNVSRQDLVCIGMCVVGP